MISTKCSLVEIFQRILTICNIFNVLTFFHQWTFQTVVSNTTNLPTTLMAYAWRPIFPVTCSHAYIYMYNKSPPSLHSILHLLTAPKDRNVWDRSDRTLTGHAIFAMATLTSRNRLLLGMIFAWNDCYVLQIFRKLQLRCRAWLFLRKANEQTFPTIYCPHRNIVNFSRMIRMHFC